MVIVTRQRKLAMVELHGNQICYPANGRYGYERDTRKERREVGLTMVTIGPHHGNYRAIYIAIHIYIY